MKSKKIILDTNLWISFLISRKLSEIDRLIENQQIKLVFSPELIEEFLDVISRRKFKKYFLKNDVKKIFDYIDQFGELAKVTTDVKLCRDEKDNFLLNLSIDSKADYLVTGDKDLLVLKKIKSTEILTYPELLERLK